MSAVLSERSAFGAPARHRATRSGWRKLPVVNVSSLQMEYACVLGAFPDAAMFRSNLQLEYA
jgi:hypothetical protein